MKVFNNKLTICTLLVLFIHITGLKAQNTDNKTQITRIWNSTLDSANSNDDPPDMDNTDGPVEGAPGFDDDVNDVPVPIDGGLSFLAIAGVGYGVKKVVSARKKNAKASNALK